MTPTHAQASTLDDATTTEGAVPPAGPLRMPLALWGAGGVLLILLEPAARLGMFAVQAFRMPLSVGQWVFAAVWAVFMGYTEGYKAFQQRFAPRVVGRAIELARAPTLGRAIFAPFYAMSLFGDSRKRLIVSWTLVFAIATITIAVKRVNQPWRGLIDAGVSLALLWGCGCLVSEFVKQVRAARATT